MSTTTTTTEKSQYMNNFENLLEPGKEPIMTKPYRAQSVQNFENKLNPQTLKRHVLASERISHIIKYYAQHNNTTKAHIKRQVIEIIDEIGLDRSLAIIRWCGIAITAIGKRICDAIYVNKTSIECLKSNLTNNNNPVLYLPSHRSYMDFILMSYICFHYDIEIPGIAAGMDFHSMFGMGTMLRKTGAFFMRRSFSNDELYWDVFREYMYALVANYHIGVEFFIEGTRSRNFKSLKPKVGLLSMALLPYFTGDVKDITVIPVSISYDRILEEQLFVYELLGVPKPKESTKGFFKALKIIDERFGRMFIEFGQPISVKNFFKDSSTSLERATIASNLQKLNKHEIELIKQLANEVVFQQQRGIVLSTFNLICLYYACVMYLKQQKTTTTTTIIRIDTLPLILIKMKGFFEKLGACVAITTTTSSSSSTTTTTTTNDNITNNVNNEILNTLKIHKNIMEFLPKANINNGNFKLKKLAIENLNQVLDMQRLKAHALKPQTMAIAVPVIYLQLYINPTLFWLVTPGFLLLAALRWQHENQFKIQQQQQQLPFIDLKRRTKQIEHIFKHEFVIEHSSTQDTTVCDYERILELLQEHHVFIVRKKSTEIIDLKVYHNRFSYIILAALAPFLCLYYQLAVTLSRLSRENVYTMGDIMILQQQRIEQLMTINTNLECAKQFVHPYCLALDNLHVAMTYFLQEKFLFPETMDPQENPTKSKKIPLYRLNINKPIEPLVQELYNYCEVLPFQQYFEEFESQQISSFSYPSKL